MGVRKTGRRGVSAVEFAIILPFLVVLIVGMVEVSRGMLVKETLSVAARHGCRAGIIPAATTADIQAAVDEVLKNNGLDPKDATVTVLVNDKEADAGTAKRNDKVSVTVSVPTSKVAWLSSYWYLGSRSTQGETMHMMRQG